MSFRKCSERHFRDKELLLCLLAFYGCLGAQPQGDVGGLHRLRNHSYQVVAQGVQVCLSRQLGVEGSRVFLASYFLL